MKSRYRIDPTASQGDVGESDSETPSPQDLLGTMAKSGGSGAEPQVRASLKVRPACSGGTSIAGGRGLGLWSPKVPAQIA